MAGTSAKLTTGAGISVIHQIQPPTGNLAGSFLRIFSGTTFSCKKSDCSPIGQMDEPQARGHARAYIGNLLTRKATTAKRREKDAKAKRNKLLQVYVLCKKSWQQKLKQHSQISDIGRCNEIRLQPASSDFFIASPGKLAGVSTRAQAWSTRHRFRATLEKNPGRWF
jgi:hypothetical protein